MANPIGRHAPEALKAWPVVVESFGLMNIVARAQHPPAHNRPRPRRTSAPAETWRARTPAVPRQPGRAARTAPHPYLSPLRITGRCAYGLRGPRDHPDTSGGRQAAADLDPLRGRQSQHRKPLGIPLELSRVQQLARGAWAAVNLSSSPVGVGHLRAVMPFGKQIAEKVLGPRNWPVDCAAVHGRYCLVVSRRRAGARRVAVFALPVGLSTFPVLAAVALVVYGVVAPARREFRDGRLLFIVALAGGVSAVVSAWPVASLEAWLGWLGLGAALMLLMTRWSASDGAALLAGMSVAVLLILGAELHQRILMGLPRPSGFAFHPNVEAAVLVALLGTSATGLVALGSKKPGWRLTLGFVLAAGVAALLLTGSRSAIVGMIVGIAVALVQHLWRASWQALVAWLFAALLLFAGFFAANRLWFASVPHNRVENSGFAYGQFPWTFGTDSGIVDVVGDGVPGTDRAVRLMHSEPKGQVLLGYASPIPVRPGDRLTFSAWMWRPQSNAPEAFLRIIVRTADGTPIAQLSRSGWTAGSVQHSGGLLALATQQEGVWERVTYPLPRLPAGAEELEFAILAFGKQLGACGYVNSLQLEEGAKATPYVPGRRPGVADLFRPLIHRTERAFRRPIGSLRGRIAMWRAGFRIASVRPLLGYGPGSGAVLARNVAARYDGQPLTHFHSLYLKVLLEGGVATLIPLLIWLALLIRRLLQRYQAGSSSALLALATVVALLVQGLVDEVLAQPYVLGIVWLAVCIAMEGANRQSEERCDSRPPE